MLSEWAMMVDDEGIIVNYYGPVEADLHLSEGKDVKLIQRTDYPVNGHIDLIISPKRAGKFNLRLRIPQWSKKTVVRVNDAAVEPVNAGSYLSINRTWNDNDRIEMELDMSLRFEPGQRNYEGHASIHHGPLLLAYDQHFNDMDPDDVPALDTGKLDASPAESHGQFQPIILLKVRAADGRSVNLCDFATAGGYGTNYRSWLRNT